MKRLTITLLLTLILAPSLRAATRAEALYEQAMIKESGERDPEAALELYKQAIEHAGKDHRLIAKARLQMAGCQERLGKPKEAEALYLLVINEPAHAPADTVQAAQTHLETLQAQEKKAKEDAAKARPMVLVKEFHDTRFSGIVGPELLVSGSHLTGDLSLAGRYRLTRTERPLALHGEFGLLFPLGSSTIKDDTQTYNLTTTDTASLKLKYQMHVALVAELPHKTPKTIPEVGVGAAFTSSKISYTSTNSTGDSSEIQISPYLVGGIRFMADKRVSLLVQTTYTANPYAKNIEIASPEHKQTFDMPDSIWTIGAQAQIKIGWTKAVMRPKE